MQRENKKIIFTGGHAATTAYATIEELQSRQTTKKWDISWVGARNAFEGKSAPTIESKVFPSLGLKQYFLTTGRIQRKFTIWTIPSLFKIPLGFIQALALILRIRPDLIISFGGFVAPPVVFAGWLCRIPVIIHEQTFVAGRANLFSARFATKIAISRNELTHEFPASKTVVVGNPVRKAIRSIPIKKKLSQTPLLYVTGGSRGATFINESIGNSLSELLKKYKIIHQTGELEYTRYKALKGTLDKSLQSRYWVYGTIAHVEKILEKVDIIIGRSGANTVSEAMIISKPSLFIPLQIARNDEQLKNAQMAQKHGIARILQEDDLTKTRLLEELDIIVGSWSKMVDKSVKNQAIDAQAHALFVDVIERVLRK